METIEEQLNSLKIEVKTYGDEIISHISTLHSNYHEDNISLKTDPKLMVLSLQQDVNNLILESQNHSEYLEKNHSEIEECRKLLSILTNISNVSEMISECDEVIHGNDILLSSRSLQTLQDNINNLPSTNTDIGTGKVCLLLRKEFSILQSKFQTRLKRLLRNSINIEQGKISIVKRLKGGIKDEEVILQTPILIHDIWNSLLQTSSLSSFNEYVNLFIKDIWYQVMKPLWKLKKVPFPHISRGDDSSELVYDSFAKENVVASCKYLCFTISFTLFALFVSQFSLLYTCLVIVVLIICD